MAISQENTTPTAPSRRRNRARTRLLVTLCAAMAAGLVWAVAVPLLGNDVMVPERYGSDKRIALGIVPVIFAATLASLAGWALLATLERFLSRRAARVWTIIALVVFVVTLPWMPDATATDITVLALLHAVVAAVVIFGMPRANRPERQR